jgi:ABC-type branched-subunit amino acid transport system substrate-binding protein
VRLIIPFLDYFNVEGVRLLGSNAWNTPKLTELAGEYVEGAVFVDSFFARSTRSGTARFTKRFTDAYGYEPGAIEAQAYDAATTILEAIGRGPASREVLKERLRESKGLKGPASGTIGFDEDGEARRKLFLLTVEGGRIVELTE